MKQSILSLLFISFTLFVNGQDNYKNINPSQDLDVINQRDSIKPEWPSIARHGIPEWFRDAKFGIYTSWGPVVMATQYHTTEWFGRLMYQKKRRIWTNALHESNKAPTEFELSKTKWGDQSQFGYKDFIKLFQPKKFNAEEWADLFYNSGAKFCGPLAIHHDNYAMWNSDITRWNSKKMAGIDVCGDLEKAIKSRGMKFVMTFHHAYTWWYFTPSYNYDGGKPGNEDLYCRPHKFSTDGDSFQEYPDSSFENMWYRKLEEACVKYKPDLAWFDMGLELLSDKIREKALSRIINIADRNNQDLGISYKVKYSVSVPPKTGILDYEKGRSTIMREDPWLTDTPLGGWYYNTTPSRSSKAIIEMLVDIISKNGCLLLDVSPMPDGTIPLDQKKTLLEIGQWLKINGEAVYNTRPWTIYGEGPTNLSSDGHFNENWESIYTSSDIRFTRSKDGKTVYLFVMNRPALKYFTVKCLSTINPWLQGNIESISLIGYDNSIKWKRGLKGLKLEFPQSISGNKVYCYRLKIK